MSRKADIFTRYRQGPAKVDQKNQRERFVETARRLGADEDEADERAVEALAPIRGGCVMLSRRGWLVLLLGLTGVLAVGRDRAAETQPQKLSKETAKYQDHPNNMRMCGMCKFYIPHGGRPGHGMMGGQTGGGMMGKGQMGMMQPGTCQLVEGTINPMGWCQLYQPISTQNH